MPNRNPRPLPIIDNYVDILVNIFTLLVTFLIVPTLLSVPEELYSKPVIYVAMFFLCLAASYIYQLFGTYSENAYIRFREAAFGYLRANALIGSTLFLISLLLTNESRLFWGTVIGLQFVFSTSLLLVKREITMSVLHYFRIHRYQLRKVILVGDNTDTAKQYLHQINVHPEYGLMVLGYVGDCIRSDVGCDKLGSFENLGEILDRYRPDEVVFAIDSYNKKRLIRLVNQCDDRFIKVFFLPVLYGYFKSTDQITRVGDVPLINIHATPMENRSVVVFKRFADVVGSFFLLVLSSPLLLITALVVRFSTGTPVLEKQERVGQFGRKFTLYKFNTAKKTAADPDAEKSPFAVKLGAILRATAIDELPELFNVLRGDMSLVGPRPEFPDYVDSLRAQIPSYMLKHYCKPGLTGLSQIKGFRSESSLTARLTTDIRYIEEWSIWKDLLILLATPFCAFNRAELKEPTPREEIGEAAIDEAVEELGVTGKKPSKKKQNADEE